MKAKHLIVLILLAAALGAWAYFAARKGAQGGSLLVGTRVFSELPVNSVSKIVITAPGSTVVVARIREIWTVPSRFNYPAKFDKIADTLIQLRELNIGQVVNISTEQLGELKLLSPRRAGPEKAGTLVELMDSDEQLLDYLIIGRTFTRQSDRGMEGLMPGFGGSAYGQYVRRSDDKVFLVSQTLGRLTEDARTWMDDELVDVQAVELTEITVDAPDREAIRLYRDEDGVLALEGIDDNNESTDSSKINSMAGALRYLNFEDVVSPALAPEATGMDAPVVFAARTKGGQVYTLKIGNETDDGCRYLRIGVAYDVPRSSGERPGAGADGAEGEPETAEGPAPGWDQALADQSEKLNAGLSKWTYTIRGFRVEPMLLSREDIVITREADFEDVEQDDQTGDADARDG